MIALARDTWPVARAGEAMQAAAAEAGLPSKTRVLPEAPASVQDGEKSACRAWIQSLGGCLELQLEPRPVTWSEILNRSLRGPGLLQISIAGRIRLLAIAAADARRVTIVPPDCEPFSVAATQLGEAIGVLFECSTGPELSSLLDEAAISGPDRRKILQSMVTERVGETPIGTFWPIALPASAGLLAHVRHNGLPKMLAAFLPAYGFEYGLWILSWALVGKWAIAGRFDMGWLMAWALLLMTLVPIHMLVMWQQAKFSVSCGWIVMRLLLEGSFRLQPEEVRHEGAGQLIGRVLESEALQSLALNGGLAALMACIQLLFAVALFAFGMESWALTITLLAWISATAALGLVYHRRRGAWTNARLNLSRDLLERIVGHRTRLVQQPVERWHEGEDEALAEYVEKSKRIDRVSVAILAFLPRGWLLAGVLCVIGGLWHGNPQAGMVAAQLGGVLLAFGALTSASSSIAMLSGAAIAAERAGDMLRASRRAECAGDPAVTIEAGRNSSGHLLEIREMTFRYPGRAANAIEHNSLRIDKGERILLEGASGSGKSTWVGLVSGLRLPDSGLLLMRGIDRKTLGDAGWRRRVVAAPQFHENHMLTGSLAFNLLLGRSWPPEPEDLEEAETVCRELALGPLLDRMPAGLMQVVGESGWQLSNGEKSRVFLARALLQHSDLVIVDESFGGLDPETAQTVMAAVLKRAPTLVCVAHV